jgi:hypothetical protein
VPISDDVSRMTNGNAERVDQLRSIHGGAPLMTRQRFRRDKAGYLLCTCLGSRGWWQQ